MNAAFCRPLRKAKATNSTSSSFPSKIPTVTEPSGDGVHNLGTGPGGQVPAWLKVLAYGSGNENQTFDLRVIGWNRTPPDALNTVMWIPSVLGQFTCTLSAIVGVAGGYVVDTERFVDTLIIHATIAAQLQSTDVTADASAAAAASTGKILICSPANDLIAHMLVPLEGCEKVEFTFDMTGATDGNCLFSFV